MRKDVVDRLNSAPAELSNIGPIVATLMHDAAVEIVQLRHALNMARNAFITISIVKGDDVEAVRTGAIREISEALNR